MAHILDIPTKTRVKVVREHLNGKRTLKDICYSLGIGQTTLIGWIRRYKAFGPKSLEPWRKHYYSKSFKQQVVNDYLNGEGSVAYIITKYNLSSEATVRNWIKVYNRDKDLNSKGVNTMPIKRNTTQEERLEIVSFCIANDCDYNLTSNKYNVSYQQVYSWVKKYESNGFDALVDRRGQSKPVDSLTESDKIMAKLKAIEAENERLRMENDFLKKLQEIERR